MTIDTEKLAGLIQQFCNETRGFCIGKVGIEQTIPHIAYIARNGFAATLQEQAANAHVIAAAPELLERLKGLAAACQYTNALSGPLGKEILAQAYATIDKAEGRAKATAPT